MNPGQLLGAAWGGARAAPFFEWGSQRARDSPSDIVKALQRSAPATWAEIAEFLRELEQLGLASYRLSATQEEPVQLRLEISSG